MKLEEVQKAIKEGNAEFIKQPEQPETKQPEFDDFAKFVAVLDLLRRPKYHITAAPSFTPKSFLEQIQFYENGATRRIYFYINGSWRYATLT